MKMTGQNVIPASREEVWAALNDPDALKESIPGAEHVTKVADDEFEAAVQAKVGPVRANFKGKIKLNDIDPPNGYTITGEGSGGAAGFAKGAAKVKLTDAEGGGTLLAYDVDAAVGGKLAQIGQRLIQGTAKKMADEFFANFAARFGEGAPAEAAPEPEAVAEEPAAAPAAAPAAGGEDRILGLPRQQVMVIAGAIIAIAVLYLIVR